MLGLGWGEIGMLHDALFRAVRLVVDSGMHDKRWSRERAVKYMVDTVGDQESSAITEIERYAVWPGQATSYMVGKLKIMQLREKAKAALGPRFDLRKFHDAVKDSNKNVEWVVYGDEGHGWKLLATRLDFWGRVEKFLQQQIGGAR